MNSQNKQQAIKAAYGEYWDKVKNYVDDNGWIELYSYNCYTDTVYTDLTEDLPFLKELGYERKYFNNGHTHYVRPKSLSGIETNQGWTKIESEEDLPINGMFCKTCFYSGGKYIEGHIYFRSYEDLKWAFKKEMITHYKKIGSDQPPIF